MKSKDIRILDKSIIILCFLQVCVFNYLDISDQCIKIISFLIILSFFNNGKIFKKTVLKVAMLLAALIICFISSRLGHNNHFDIMISNMNAITYVTLVLIYFSDLMLHHFVYIDKILMKNFWLLNGYGIVNIVVTFIQILKPGFMTGKSMWINNMSEDLISGTFGYSCTPQMGMFFCFLLFYNLYYFMRKPQKKWVELYNIILLIYLIVISTFNDNKAVYIELLIFGILYIFINRKLNITSKIKKKAFRIYFVIIGISICLIVAYMVILPFRKILDSNLIYAIKLFIKATQSESVLGYGSAERIYTVIQAFSKYDAIHFGYGTGDFIWQAGVALGFKHFGLADLGSFLCLGGLWFTISVIGIYIYNINEIVNSNRIIKNLIFLIILTMFFYSQIMTSNTLCIIFIFLMIVMGMIRRYSIILESGE